MLLCYRNSVACDVFIRYIVIMDNYQPLFLILCALIFFYATCQSVYEGENDKRVSRRRRYVVFPLGSTFSVSYRNTYCIDSKLDFLNGFDIVHTVHCPAVVHYFKKTN
jgi:hypothetical protein